MDAQRFDAIAKALTSETSRRRTLGGLLGGTLGLLGWLAREDVAVGKKKKKQQSPESPAETPLAVKGPRETCTPGQDQCSAGLQCSTPTTRHSCASSIPRSGAWCCVPPGGRCTECDCCGDYYCSYDNNTVPSCVPNPEG